MKRSLGSRLDNWLKEEGLLGQATAKAIKSTLSWQIAQAMKERRISDASLRTRTDNSAMLAASCVLSYRTFRPIVAVRDNRRVLLGDIGSPYSPEWLAAF